MIPGFDDRKTRNGTTRFFRVGRPTWLEAPLGNRRVCCDAHYTLSKPCVKITLSISHNVATQFQKRNSFFLAPPLSERLDGKPCDSGDVLGRQKGGRRSWRHSCEFCGACHSADHSGSEISFLCDNC